MALQGVRQAGQPQEASNAQCASNVFHEIDATRSPKQAQRKIQSLASVIAFMSVEYQFRNSTGSFSMQSISDKTHAQCNKQVILWPGTSGGQVCVSLSSRNLVVPLDGPVRRRVFQAAPRAWLARRP